MKALVMQTYQKPQTVEIIKVTPELIEEVKHKSKALSRTLNDEYDIVQTLEYDNGLYIHEIAKQQNKNLKSESVFDVYLKAGDILINTGIGYQKNVLPVKILTDKEERLIEKYNKLGGK